MSTVVQVGSSWQGFANIKRLVIFGDSYSSILSRDRFTHGADVVPTVEHPLGEPYPGQADGLWNEPDQPNWVGYLLTRYRPGPRFNPDAQDQDPAWVESPLLVHDYAIGGAEVADVADQLHSFLKGDGGSSALRSPEEALFITWIGINDCADSNGASHSGSVKALFNIQEKLYASGARNLLFIDVPPIHRSPAIQKWFETHHATSYDTWNTRLLMSTREFGAAHPDATIMVCSAKAVFNAILDFPEDYGFAASDSRAASGGIWYDHLHPTSAMHEHVASHLADFLDGVPSAKSK